MNNENISLQESDTVVLETIVRGLTQATAEYNTVLAEARVHKKRALEHRAAIEVLRTRLVSMRDAARAWDKALWNLGWRDQISAEARVNVERQVRVHSSLLDELIWQLFEFRGENQ
jgi:hypothetical protein